SRDVLHGEREGDAVLLDGGPEPVGDARPVIDFDRAPGVQPSRKHGTDFRLDPPDRGWRYAVRHGYRRAGDEPAPANPGDHRANPGKLFFFKQKTAYEIFT